LSHALVAAIRPKVFLDCLDRGIWFNLFWCFCCNSFSFFVFCFRWNWQLAG